MPPLQVSETGNLPPTSAFRMNVKQVLADANYILIISFI